MNENRVERYHAMREELMPTFVLSPAAAVHQLIERVLDLEDKVKLWTSIIDGTLLDEDESGEDEDE